MRDVAWVLALAGAFSCGGGDARPAETTAGDGAGPAIGGDAGTVEAAADARAKPDCTRSAQTRTAPAALFDSFAADVANLASQADRDARAAKLVADVGAQGGTPLEDAASDRVVFLVHGAPPQGPWSVAGSFGGWKAGAVAMQQVAGTDVWFADAHVPRGSSAQYKLLSGGDDSGFREDLLARNVAWDGIDRGAPGEFNAIVHPGDADPTRGRLVAWRGLHSQTLADDRDVFVYLPARYDDPSCAALSTIVFHDGNESLTRGDFAGAADAEYGAHPEESAILAFVALPDQNVRIDEYTFATPTALGDAYGAFLANELQPKIASSFRTCASAAARGIAGASLGGLISVYLAFGHSDVWGYVGAQSPSLFWDDGAMIARASRDPIVDVRFYLDNGVPGDTCASDDNCAVTQQMSDALAAKGYDVTHVAAAGAQHDWPYWRARIPQLLARFRAGKGGCE